MLPDQQGRRKFARKRAEIRHSTRSGDATGAAIMPVGIPARAWRSVAKRRGRRRRARDSWDEGSRADKANGRRALVRGGRGEQVKRWLTSASEHLHEACRQVPWLFCIRPSCAAADCGRTTSELPPRVPPQRPLHSPRPISARYRYVRTFNASRTRALLPACAVSPLRPVFIFISRPTSPLAIPPPRHLGRPLLRS